MAENKLAIQEEVIMNKIYLIRDQKVMLDSNLKSQIATSSWGGRRKLSHVLTEQVGSILSIVLNFEQTFTYNTQLKTHNSSTNDL
ncbi:MAG: hypothetical protein HQ521_09305 [Bacteroidetes bacterium]|nr:hypothetical protein [Bacteroidota bacterium]